MFAYVPADEPFFGVFGKWKHVEREKAPEPLVLMAMLKRSF